MGSLGLWGFVGHGGSSCGKLGTERGSNMDMAAGKVGADEDADGGRRQAWVRPPRGAPVGGGVSAAPPALGGHAYCSSRATRARRRGTWFYLSGITTVHYSRA